MISDLFRKNHFINKAFVFNSLYVTSRYQIPKGTIIVGVEILQIDNSEYNLEYIYSALFVPDLPGQKFEWLVTEFHKGFLPSYLEIAEESISKSCEFNLL